MFNYADRIARAQSLLAQTGVSGLIVAPSAQMRYLLGWAESGHERLLALFVPAQGDPTMVVPAINAAQARTNAAGVGDVRGWAGEIGWGGVVADLLRGWDDGPGAIAVDDELMAGHLLALQALAPARQWAAAGPLMAGLRRVKAAEEIDALARSAEVTDGVYEDAVGCLREGMTETELRDLVVAAYRRRGARCDFAIVCFGANSALPHHAPGNAALKPGDVVILDIGCSVDGYASDITRTVAFGEPGDDARRIYRTVLDAHLAAVAAGRPGVTCEAVDAAARRVIDAAGFGPHFIHRTGHGIGLAGHEEPYIVAGNTLPLEPGMCFSVEPGIYLEGRFGVRVENIVTVEPDGLRSLNGAPPAELMVVPA